MSFDSRRSGRDTSSKEERRKTFVTKRSRGNRFRAGKIREGHLKWLLKLSWLEDKNAFYKLKGAVQFKKKNPLSFLLIDELLYSEARNERL